jgi:hypothetical protein
MSLILSLAKVRRRPTMQDTDFERLYELLMSAQALPDRDLIFLLARATLFLRADDRQLNRLGYRILLQYAAVTEDFRPLHEVAIAKDYVPVVAAIERAGFLQRDVDSFAATFWDAHLQNFKVGPAGSESFRTRGQMGLRSFAGGQGQRTVVVAPTSYGKSEMIVDRVSASIGQQVCVVVPSKALIAQTKRALLESTAIRESHTRVLTHPDAVVDAGAPFIAVLTQERLSRLLRRHPELALDVLLVDEAHNAMAGDERAEHLVQALMAVKHRNADLRVTYFTPFVADPGNLAMLNDQADISGMQIDEYVKIERIHFTRLARGELYLYDQFLGRPIVLGTEERTDELQFVMQHAGRKNVLYLNRPRDAENVARELAALLPQMESDALEGAIGAISDLIHPDYGLIDCLRSGVAFHHGRVPEILRQFVEQLFSSIEAGTPRFLATTSTLLEGVNTPTDVMFILSPSKGLGYLTRAAFKNLIGRTGRFREIFHPSQGDLSLLQPNIYVLDGQYTRSNFNPENFLKRVADVQKQDQDSVLNALLAAHIEGDRREQLLEYLENVEPGASGLDSVRRAQTTIGQLCFQNNVLDFDIITSEQTVQRNLDLNVPEGTSIQTPNALVEAIIQVFLSGLELVDADDLARVRDNPGAQQFYAMFLGWRAEATPMRLMIGQFLGYWRRLTDPFIFVGSSWGEFARDGSTDGPLLFVRMSEKSEKERVNLAVAKIKEEQDFVDYQLMKYVEIFHDLFRLSESFYNRLKYGTDESGMIALLKLGFSMELARLVRNEYWEFIAYDADAEFVALSQDLIEAMQRNDENEILIYELQCHL